ncbi:hypothetical protein M918_05815 [Clostridium sp. BL8]|nr:hypothetical protein M918_05815 [Clostridium sp. BL8]
MLELNNILSKSKLIIYKTKSGGNFLWIFY